MGKPTILNVTVIPIFERGNGVISMAITDTRPAGKITIDKLDDIKPQLITLAEEWALKPKTLFRTTDHMGIMVSASLQRGDRAPNGFKKLGNSDLTAFGDYPR
jgi:hypothetical protein